MVLQPWDQVSVRTAPNFRKNENRIYFGRSGLRWCFMPLPTKQMRISDLVQMSGGYTPKAYLKGATLERFFR